MTLSKLGSLRIPLHKYQTWLAPFTIFWAMFLAYGIYIPWLGLYGDDWLYLWNYHLLGPLSFTPFVAVDRPFSAWIYILSTALLGEHIWAYHVLAFLLRFLSVLALWWVLSLIWPRSKRQVLAVALLFAVYPGFKQQAVPIEFILHFTGLGLFLASLGLMILAVRGVSQGKPLRQCILLELLSLVCAMGMFSVEYFVGLELIRPVILWLALNDSVPAYKKRLQLILTWYWPYLLLLVGFVSWRVFYQKFEFYQPLLLNRLRADTVQGIIGLARRVITDLYLVTAGAWRQVLVFTAGLRTFLISLAMVVFSLVTIGWLVISRRDVISDNLGSASSNQVAQSETEKRPGSERENNSGRYHWAIQAGLLSLAALLVAGIPFWVTDIPLTLNFPWDRATLPFMLGASLILTCLVELIFKPKLAQVVVVLLVSLSIGAFAINARSYMKVQSAQDQLIWQLAWRAPQLKPGTTLITEKIYVEYIQDNALTPIVNWTYAPHLATNQVPYNVYELENRRNSAYNVDLSPGGMPIERSLRSEVFSGSTSNMLLFTFRIPSCLRIIRPDDVSTVRGLPTLKEIQNLSRLEQITASFSDQMTPPLSLSTEPPHTWCYYFEKADLARQLEDWSQIVTLWATAADKRYMPANLSEYEPFIEAFARLKDWDKAVELSKKAIADPKEVEAVCAIWSMVAHSMLVSSGNTSDIQASIKTLGCPTP